METSTVLFKTKRYRICDKTTLANEVNHILRNYKPETIQYKRDFNADETKNNLIIGSDYQIKTKGENWFANEVEIESDGFKDKLKQSLTDADNHPEIKISLSRRDKDLTLKSITYFSNCENYTPEEENHILKISSQCLDFKLQKQTEKNYSVIDKDDLQSALDFYDNPPENVKIKSLNAKKKHLTRMIETLDKMAIHNDKRPTAETRSIGFEEILLKIPKHNEKSIKDVDMIEIVKDWNNTYFSNFQVIGGAIHKDERTKKGNEADDHLHLIRSGFNQKTRRFDLPDFTHQLGLELAQNQGLDFVADGKKYNETTEENRTIASEALQTEFYRFANERLVKLGYNFQFEKKELNEEEKELRTFLKEQSNLPKAKRKQNLATFYEEQAKKARLELKKANARIEEKDDLIQELISEEEKLKTDVQEQKDEAIQWNKKAKKQKQTAIHWNKKAKEQKGFFEKFKDQANEKIQNWLKDEFKPWFTGILKFKQTGLKEDLEPSTKAHITLENERNDFAELLSLEAETHFTPEENQIYQEEVNNRRKSTRKNRP